MGNTILKEETLSHKLISKGFWVYVFTVFTAPLGYLLRLLASNTLSVADVGIFYGVLSMMSLLYTYNDLGLTGSMGYYLPQYWLGGKKGQIKNLIGLSFFMQMITGIIIFCLLFFNAEWLAIHYIHAVEATNVIKIMSLYFLGYNLVQVCNAIFGAFQDSFNSGLILFCNMFSVLIFAVLFWIFAGFNVSLFALSWIIGVAVGIGIGLIQIFRNYKHLLELPREGIDKNLLSTWFKYAFWIFLTANVGTLLGNVDQQLVLNRLGAESSGYFTNMLSLLNVFFLFVGPFIGLICPITIELSSRKEKEKFKLMESLMYEHFAFLAIVMGGIFLVFGQEISVLLYGENFRFSGELLQILGPCLVFNCLSSLNFSLLGGLGKIKQTFFIFLVSLVINVTFNVLALFVFHKGLNAVISVLALSWITQFVGGFIYIRKKYPFHFDWKFFFKNVLIVGILCGIFWWVRGNTTLFVPNQNRWQLLFILAGICLFYALVFAGFNWKKLKLLWNEVKKVKKGEA